MGQGHAFGGTARRRCPREAPCRQSCRTITILPSAIYTDESGAETAGTTTGAAHDVFLSGGTRHRRRSRHVIIRAHMGGDSPRTGTNRPGSSLAPAGSDLHERRPKRTRAAGRQTTSTATDPVDAPCRPCYLFWEAAGATHEHRDTRSKRWSRSKLGQPAAIYTRPGRRISLSAGAIPLSGTPLFGANPMATLAANNNKVPANTTAWKGTGTTRTDLSQYVLSRARGAVRNQTRSIRSQEQRQTRTLRKRAPAMWRESGSERKTIVV